ncbi:MAG: TonB-dependent receptor [Opitutaceae bacterium]
MNASPQIPKQQDAHRFRPVAFGLLTLAAAQMAFAQAAAPAAASTTDDTKTAAVTTSAPSDQTKKPDDVYVMNEFTVQGSFAGSLEMAAQEKQSAPAIVEVIAPEDIGVLPDVSIADDLARLTGLTSQRVNGRDQEITIRGFSPDFSVGTLDGVEQATTDDNRAVAYDQYPSELVGGVTVYKTGQADLVGGLAGTVDLETTSPLSASHRIIALSAFYNFTAYPELTPGVKKAAESFSASYIDQFANGTEGIYVGYAHTEDPYEGKQFQAWGYPTDGNGNLVLGGMKIYDQSELLKRDAVIGVLESRPNDFIHSKIDLFYSKFNDNELLNGLQVPMAEWSSAQLQPGYTVTNGLVTNYTLKNIQPVVDNQVVDYVDHIESAIWNLDLGEKSEWPVHFTTGYSQAKRNEEVLETYAGLGFNGQATDADTFVVTQEAGPNPPTVVSSTNYSNASLFTITDPQGWGTGTLPATGQEGYLKYFNETDIVDSYKIAATHELDAGIFKDLVFGMSYTERYKGDAQAPTGYLINSDGKSQDPLPPLQGTSDLTWIGNLKPISWSANGLVSSGALKLLPNPNPGTYVGDNYQVWEDVTRPFIKFDLKGNVFSVPFDGNIGVVADVANQNSIGESAGGFGSYVTPASGIDSYVDALPTLTLTFKPTSQDFIRFFAGREEQRPRMYDMRASRDFSYNSTFATSSSISPWGGSAGNPNLQPWIANAVDLDIEHYFAHGGGYVSVAVFEKKLLSYIYQQNTLTNFAGYPYTSASAPLITEGYSSQPVNGQGGNVSGVEATIQVTSEVLTGNAVRGFGVVLNGLLVDSNIQPWGPNNPSSPLPDLAKKSANLTFYYEGHGMLDGFSARVSDHYQSQTREYIVQFGVPTPAAFGTPGDGFSEEIPYHTIDAQVSYTFKHGTLKGLGLYLEGRNLNNAPLITYNNGDPRQLENWQEYGASYRAGVTYKF